MLVPNNPCAWPVGILPIAGFLYGVVHLVLMTTRRVKPGSSVLPASVGVSGGLIAGCAWVLGLNQHEDFALWKYLIFILVGAAITALVAVVGVRNTEYSHKWINEWESRTNTKRTNDIALSGLVFLGLIAAFWLLENYMSNGPSQICRKGEFLLGSRQSIIGELWFFSALSSLALLAFILNIWAIWQTRNKI